MTLCKLIERVLTKEQDLQKTSRVKLIRSLEMIAIIIIRRATYSGKGQLACQIKLEQRELEHYQTAIGYLHTRLCWVRILDRLKLICCLFITHYFSQENPLINPPSLSTPSKTS